MGRVTVNKTWKMLIGGAFVRSESGRVFAAPAAGGKKETGEAAGPQACRGSRKDLRNAVEAADKAFDGWSVRNGFNRGQILYRLGEMIESRAAEWAEALRGTAGGSSAAAKREVAAAVDRAVYYAGWADKFAQVLASTNPVAGPYFNFTAPEPTGVIGVIGGARTPLTGLLSQILPAVVGGNTVVALAPEEAPVTAVLLGEAVAVSDFPAGVINLLTGFREELTPAFASHEQIRGLDFVLPRDAAGEVEREAAAAIKRCRWRETGRDDDWLAEGAESVYEIRRFLEFKTVWHPHQV